MDRVGERPESSCRTVVFACVAPTLLDLSMTLNTLRYVAPIKQSARMKKVEPNLNNPANWDNARMKTWVEQASRGTISPESLCPWESGKQLLRIPEADFLRRITEAHSGVGGKISC